uniref:Uncharacterized protein n=1 Tax=Amphiprion percula TaxID=161767 RepID=A0A3P8SS46_AMPPE
MIFFSKKTIHVTQKTQHQPSGLPGSCVPIGCPGGCVPIGCPGGCVPIGCPGGCVPIGCPGGCLVLSGTPEQLSVFLLCLAADKHFLCFPSPVNWV